VQLNFQKQLHLSFFLNALENATLVHFLGKFSHMALGINVFFCSKLEILNFNCDKIKIKLNFDLQNKNSP